MKKVQIVVTVVSLYLLVYLVALFTGVSPVITYSIFALSPFLVVYMVYVVLKYGKPSKYTFDERFYNDLDYTRNGKES